MKVDISISRVTEHVCRFCKLVRNHFPILLLSTAVSFCSFSCYGASFDCKKATSNVEEMICADEELSHMDSELAAIYKKVLTTSKNAAEIKANQQHWLLVERNSCANYGCIKAAYEKRINELNLPETEQKITTIKKGGYLGEYVLRAAAPLRGDSTDYIGFCSDFTANLNEFRSLDFNTCDARLSAKYPRFTRPQWDEIPLDMDLAKRVLTDRPSVGFERWFKITESARSAGEVKLWRIQVDLLNDGNLDTLIRLDHASDGTQPYCDYIDSKQMITNVPNPESAKWYAHAQFYNDYRLGGDMIYDASTKRYYLLDWNRYGGVHGEGLSIGDIGASASVMVYGANRHGVYPQCWIDWVLNGHYRSLNTGPKGSDSIENHHIPVIGLHSR